MLPSLGEAIGLLGNLVQEVPMRAGGDAAEDAWPLGGGPHLSRLQQGGPADVGEPGEEGVHLGGHLLPGCRGVRVGGGGGAGGQGHCPTPGPTNPPPQHGACRLPLEGGEAAGRAEVPTVGGLPTLHPAIAGWPPHRRACHVLPQWRQVPSPRVEKTGALVVGAGARAKRTLGYLHCSAWPTMAPLVPNSGPAGPWTADSEDGAVRAPARMSYRRTTPGHSPSRGARAQVVLAHPCRWWRAGNTRAAWPYHHRNRAKPWCRRQFQGSEEGGPGCLHPRPRPRPRGPRAMGKRNRWRAAGWPV